MPMTRAQIKGSAVDLLGEDAGQGTAGDRMMLMDTWLNTSADEIARATDCYYGSVSLDVTAGVPLYSAPQVYKVKAATYVLADRSVRELSMTTPAALDARSGAWRTAPNAPPSFCAVEGANLLRLYPAPDSSSLINAYTDLAVSSDGLFTLSSATRPFLPTDAGLTLRVPPSAPAGFVPGSYTILSVNAGVATLNAPCGAGGGTGGAAALSAGGLTVEGFLVPADSWPLATSLCPLPDRAHMAVVWRVAKYRTIQFPTKDNVARIPLIDAEYRRQLTLLEAEAHRMSDATGFGDAPRGRQFGGY